MSADTPRVNTSLRGQLLWHVIPRMLLVIAVSAAAAYILCLRCASDAYDTGLFDSARALAQQIKPGLNGSPILNLPEPAKQILIADPYDRIFYAVVATNGAQVAGNAMIPQPARLPTAHDPVVFYDAHIGAEKVRVGAYRVFQTATTPVATLLFAETLVKRERLTQRLLWILTLPLILIVAVVAVLIWDGVRRGLRPLNRLAATLSQRRWNDLRRVGTEEVPAEVLPLVDSLDTVMARLLAAHQAQERFVADAAHQLRTPLAGLSAQIGHALRAEDLTTIKPALRQIQTSSSRMTRLVNQLLLLTRAERGNELQRSLRTFDVCQLVRDTCRNWVPAAVAKNVDLGFAGDTSPLLLCGHELLIAELLNNLIDNALRYAAHPGGHLTVRLRGGAHPEIAVEDDGPGIPDSERGRIFERFHRLAGSGERGCGLGLSIVREIALLHDATVVVESRERGTGAIFRVQFPQQAVPDAAARDHPQPILAAVA